MNIPGFTADASLFTPSMRYRAKGNRDIRSHLKVVPQVVSGKSGSWERAKWVRDTLGVGRIYCYPHCEDNADGAGPQVCSEVCYWGPY